MRMGNFIKKATLEEVSDTIYFYKLNTSYETIVKLFGKPHVYGDRKNVDKFDCEWRFKIYNDSTKLFWPITIYNYKNGKCYLGDNGLAIEDINEWHVGATCEYGKDLFLKYYNDKYTECFPEQFANRYIWKPLADMISNTNKSTDDLKDDTNTKSTDDTNTKAKVYCKYCKYCIDHYLNSKIKCSHPENGIDTPMEKNIQILK